MFFEYKSEKRFQNVENKYYFQAIETHLIRKSRNGLTYIAAVDIKNFFKESSTLQWDELYDYNASNWWGAGVRYSIDTKVGPVSLDITSSNISRKVNLYFSFGYFF